MGGCISQPSDYACIEDGCQSYPTKRGSCPFCKDHEEPATQFQLVILGPGYTGKTTLRQHLVQRYGHAFYHGDLLMYRDILQNNVLDLFRDLLADPSMQLRDAREYTQKHQQSPQPYLPILMKKLEEQDLKYGRDNARFLLENCETILKSDYSPKFSDLLHCHVRSTGLMFEHHVLCKDLPLGPNHEGNVVFRVVDVGGHRNERKKWTYVLQQDNDVIVFVVSATSFCQVLFEDFRTNSLRESLIVWSNLLKSQYVCSSNSELILVLNKIDLFRERHHLLPKYFPEYTDDPNDFDQCLSFIKKLFFDVAKTHEQKIHFVTTQLTDEHEIDAFDVERIRINIRQSQYGSELPCELIKMMIEFAVGHTVFWSPSWLQQMWEKRHSLKAKEVEERRKRRKNNDMSDPHEFCTSYSYDPTQSRDKYLHRNQSPYYTPHHFDRPFQVGERIDSDSDSETPSSSTSSSRRRSASLPSPSQLSAMEKFRIRLKQFRGQESIAEVLPNGSEATNGSEFDEIPLISRSSSLSSVSSFFGSLRRSFRFSSSGSSVSVFSDGSGMDHTSADSNSISSDFDHVDIMDDDDAEEDVHEQLEICEGKEMVHRMVRVHGIPPALAVASF